MISLNLYTKAAIPNPRSPDGSLSVDSSGDPVGILTWVSSARPDIRRDAEMLSITRNYLPRVDEARL
ncbi:unnamed protein product [Arctogadus glacialis]